MAIDTRLRNSVLFLACFFLYGGYYVGLEIIIALGLMDYSRYYSVPLRLILTSLMAIYLLKSIGNRFSKKAGFILVMFGLFFFQYIVMVLVNLYEQNYMLKKYEYIFYLLSYSIINFLFFFTAELYKFKLVMKAFIYSGFLLSVLSFFLYGSFFLEGGGRINQLSFEGNINFVSPLVLSYASVFNFIISWIYWKEYKNKRNHLTWAVILMLLFSIPMFILGASRGAFVAMFLCAVYIITFSDIRTKISSVFIIPLVGYVVYLITVKTGNNAFDRLFSIKEDIEENSSSVSRFDLWKSGWDYFMNSPVYGGYLEIDGSYPHNIFIEILMNTGIIGSIFFMIPFCVLSISMFSSKFSSFLIPLIFILGLSMHLFSGSVYSAPILFAGLGMMLNQLNKKWKSHA